MIEKFMDAVVIAGQVISEKYIGLQKQWLMLMLLPIYAIFAVLYVLVLLLTITAYSVESMFRYGITLKESFDAFKEGVMEGLNELKG
jgi:hypothetical protein